VAKHAVWRGAARARKPPSGARGLSPTLINCAGSAHALDERLDRRPRTRALARCHGVRRRIPCFGQAKGELRPAAYGAGTGRTPTHEAASTYHSANACPPPIVSYGRAPYMRRSIPGRRHAGLNVEMDGTNVCRQKEVRLQHHPVDHHHRRRPRTARRFRAWAPLGGQRQTEWGSLPVAPDFLTSAAPTGGVEALARRRPS
jgi:hypothetical protein